MEQLFVLVLVGLFALAKWMMKGGEQFLEPAEKNVTTARPMPRGGSVTSSEEERMRKFLEALGVPPTVAPPRKINPRADAPSRPLAPVRPPPVLTPRIPRQTRRDQPRQPSRPTRRKIIPLPSSEPQRTEVFPTSPAQVIATMSAANASSTEFPTTEAAASMEKTTRESREDIRALLRNGRGLRDAVILREILGPPAGLSPARF